MNTLVTAVRPVLAGKGKVPSAHGDSERPTLGVVAISQNEEKDLPAFLEHLLPWVDEIVIVDDGSTDRTTDLARAAGPKVTLIVSPRKPGEYYSHLRNKGIAAATSDWLLHMDIDERVTPELAEAVLRAIQEPTKDGYRFQRLNFSLHRPQRGWRRRWNLVHLARREKFQFGGKMHETCLLDAPLDRVGQLQGRMWHLKESDYTERLRKNFIYAQVEAETFCERRVRVRWYHLLLQPLRRALRCYFLDGAFQDGVVGLIDGLYVFSGTFAWYAIAWERQNHIAREELEENVRQLWKSHSAQS